MTILMTTLRNILSQFIIDIDEGNCNISDENMKELVPILQKYSRKDIPMSKYQAYNHLNVSRATFDNYVREGKLPKGKKVSGYKELSWFQKDLDKFIEECKKK